ncbi:flavoprotein [Candidatus Neoehrlichia procyonis]|uniref:Flavofamily protein n=1 Tax=Candidatus Neoehrlichia procyonis str. RAC413 TaxID=1359163 RepID=A0A0F3NR14_9RICK|nr:flavoprotein [Candidatus Neoehrlichia lotoris]KJV69344.1 flavofamily protein [Candidatus Neoehrlichia lotoris str. RAC413]
MKILLIISGSIAAYKALDIIRTLKKRNYTINCILSKHGEKFITPLSVTSLSGNPVYTDSNALDTYNNIKHISITRNSDIILVAPATANIIAKTAYGIADDFSTSVLIAANIPIIMAPAMNPHMWQSKANQRNIRILESDNVKIIPPEYGYTTCGEKGYGKMANVQKIVKFIENLK